MTTVYIRDVSEDALAVLKARAAQAGKSLQAYVRDMVEREAAVPTVGQAAARAGRVAETNMPVSNADVLDAIDTGRAGR